MLSQSSAIAKPSKVDAFGFSKSVYTEVGTLIIQAVRVGCNCTGELNQFYYEWLTGSGLSRTEVDP